MYSLTAFLLCLLSFMFLLQIVAGIDPLYNICSSSFTYASGSPYEKNLNTLLNQLSVKVPPTGFGSSSVGHDPDTIYGLSLCRGDVSSPDCKSCVDAAGKELKQRCPTDKAAVIWYDACFIRYSNIDFIGSIDSENKFYLYNVQNVTGIASFNQKTKEFLTQLSDKAYKSSKLFATDEMKIGEVDKLYGLVQCTRDLSKLQCRKCLENAITELPNCCDQKRGGRVVGGSCNFRYELYPFVIA